MTNINRIYLNINRAVRSIIYRLILLVYGIILALLFPTLSLYVYITFFCLYIFYIIFYLRRRHIDAITRSIVDLIFIAICLYGKPTDNISVIAMLFLPVANAINHTGKGKHSYVYLLGLVAIYMNMLIVGDCEHLILQIIYALIAFSAFWAIQWLTKRHWIQNNSEAVLKDTIEDFYIHGIKHDEVYEKIGQMFIAEKFHFLDMFCFISHDDFSSMFVVNGSRFVYNYSIKIDNIQLSEIRKKMTCENISLVVDGISYNNNIAIVEPASLFKDNIDNTSYMFVLCFKNKESSAIFLLDRIKGELRRISKYLYSERIIRLRKKENFEKIKDKGRFVDSAINTMHFIKNRLSSLQTLTDVVNEMDSANINEEYIEVAKVAARRSGIDIKSILQKAKYLLNKENNPFHYQPVETCKTRKMFATLRQVWENILSNSNITVSDVEQINNDSYHIKTNMEGVEILFSDIIGNMFKYQKNICSCNCTCNNEFLTIVFKNDFVDKESVLSLVNTYNQKDKEEIIKRKTYGVSNIKSFVSDMDIILISSIENELDTELFTITLKFKLIKNESSNN